jgi:hypothetical protein
MTTVEINDAIFCEHLKEVVSPLDHLKIPSSSPHSAPIAITMEEKRTMLSMA